MVSEIESIIQHFNVYHMIFSMLLISLIWIIIKQSKNFGGNKILNCSHVNEQCIANHESENNKEIEMKQNELYGKINTKGMKYQCKLWTLKSNILYYAEGNLYDAVNVRCYVGYHSDENEQKTSSTITKAE